MADDDLESNYAETKARFESAHPSMPIRDAEFLSDAVTIFVVEQLGRISKMQASGQPLDVGDKAIQALAMRLIAIPDSDKNWCVTFPYLYEDRENRLSSEERRNRAIRFAMRTMIEGGKSVKAAKEAMMEKYCLGEKSIDGIWYAIPKEHRPKKKPKSENEK